MTAMDKLADAVDKHVRLEVRRLTKRESVCACALAKDELVQAYVATRFVLTSHVVGDSFAVTVEPSLRLRDRLRLAWICLRVPKWPA